MSHQSPSSIPDAQPKGLYKITIHARRLPSISEEAFHHHWTNVHAPKVSAWLRKHGVVGYTQYHTPSWARSEGAEKLQTLGDFATQNATGFDGYVELRMPDLGCYERARQGACSMYRDGNWLGGGIGVFADETGTWIRITRKWCSPMRSPFSILRAVRSRSDGRRRMSMRVKEVSWLIPSRANSSLCSLSSMLDDRCMQWL